jgi:glycosyltransferase 2 family protein
MRKILLRLLWILLLAALLYFALREAPLTEIWATLQQLQLWQIGLILTLNMIFYLLATARWWIIVEAENKRISFWPLFLVRVAVFGISYFTLGPQVGGEALQVLVLRQKYRLTYTHATAAVLMDKLLEFMVDFFLIAIGLTAVLRAGVIIENGEQFLGSLIVLVVLIAWPPLHLILLYHRHYPLTSLVHAIPFIHKNAKPIRFMRAAERLAGKFVQRYPRRLLTALGISLVGGAGMLVDYAVMASFVNIHLPFWKTVAGWMSGWMSLLMPLPGGLGAFEASQVFVLGKFGFSAAIALSLAFLIRGRDIFIGGVGILLAGHGVTK